MSARLQGVIPAFVIRKGGDEDDGNSVAGRVELTLHIEAGSLGHLNVRNDTSDIIELPAAK